MPNFPTAPIAAAGLIAGFAVADATGNRPLGGAVLAAGVAACAVSHPLAKQIGAWPSVFTVSAVTAGAAYLASDRRPAIGSASAS